MLKQLQSQIKKVGIARVSADLGFRDTGRVKNWLARKAIPECFHSSVSEYLKRVG